MLVDLRLVTVGTNGQLSYAEPNWTSSTATSTGTSTGTTSSSSTGSTNTPGGSSATAAPSHAKTLHNWSPSTQFINVAAAASAAIAKTDILRVMILGDSTTAGVGSAVTNWRTVSAPSFCASSLASMAPTLVGSSASFFGSGNNPQCDTRVSFNLNGAAGTDLYTGASDVGGPMIRLAVGQSATWTFNTTFDHVRVCYIDQTILFDIALDGGAPTGSPATGPNNSSTIVSNTWTVARGNHTITITPTSKSGGPAFIESVEVWDSTIPGYTEIQNGGCGGADSTAVNNLSTAWYAGLSGVVAATPNLVFLNYGINDMNNGSPSAAQFQSNIDFAVQALKARKIDVVLVMPQAVTSGGYDQFSDAFLAALSNISTNRNVPVLDLRAYFGSRSYQQSQGWVADNLHSTTAFYQSAGQLYAKVIAVATGQATSSVSAELAGMVG